MLTENRLSDCSKATIKQSLNIFHEYLRSKGNTLDEIEQMTFEQLDKYIGLFYANVRKNDHSSYSRNSMYTLRYGLQNYIKKTFKIDIISHETFRPSNEIFSAVLVQLKKNGMGSVIHKKPLTPEDFSKLYSSDVLSASTPEGLQNKVFVDLMVQLCNRGRENLRDLRRDDFELNTDSSGTRYVSMKDKQTKNHRGDSCEELSQQGRMYETPGSIQCPVASFEKYISKLNSNCSAFWQKPATNASENEPCWYKNIPVGKNSLYNKMKNLSHSAQLSTVYTNHCLRATCITTLDHSGDLCLFL